MEEELDPFVPVTAIDLLRVIPLLMIIGLVSDIDYLVEKTCTELAVICRLL